MQGLLIVKVGMTFFFYFFDGDASKVQVLLMVMAMMSISLNWFNGGYGPFFFLVIVSGSHFFGPLF